MPVILSSGQVLTGVHDAKDCFAEHCPVHNPSEHNLRGYPLWFNGKHMIRLLSKGANHTNIGDLFAIDPDDYYYNVEGVAILINSAVCVNCGEEIVSKSRHDYVRCKCGSSFVDGGPFYMRRGGSCVDTSIVALKNSHERS